MSKTTTVGVEFRAYNRSQTAIASFSRSMQRLQRSAVGLVGAYVGGRGVVGAARSVIDASIQQERATTRLHTLMGNVPGTTEKAIASTVKYTEALQRASTIGDDVGQMGASQLATFQLQSDTIDKLLPSLYDLATAVYGVRVSQEQMVTVSNLMGKAMQGQVGALTRYGVTVTDAQARTLKLGTEQQKAAAMTELLQANFGGLSQTMIHTTEGQMQQLHNTWSDTEEILGNALLPAINKAATATQDWLTDNQAHIKRWANDFVEGISIVIKAAGWVKDVFQRDAELPDKYRNDAILMYRQTVGRLDPDAFKLMEQPTGGIAEQPPKFLKKWQQLKALQWESFRQDQKQRSSAQEEYLEKRLENLQGGIQEGLTPSGGGLSGSDGASALATMDAATAYRRMAKDLDQRSAEAHMAKLRLLQGEFAQYGSVLGNDPALAEWWQQRYRNLEIDRLKDTDEWQGGFRAAALESQRDMQTLGEAGYDVASGWSNAFGGFFRQMRTDFRDIDQLAENLLDQMAAAVWEATVVKPLTSAISQSLGSALTPNALGNVYRYGRVQAFGSGAVLSGPTVFPMADGQVGLAGEAGYEAFLPLGRMRDGTLGVHADGGSGSQPGVEINIDNGSSAQVEAAPGDVTFDGRRYVVGLLLKDKRNNGPITRAGRRR